jgi:protein phosphatase 2C family protein 2/3
MKKDSSGCTAVACLVHNDTIYCANVGDSRAVLSEAGTAVPLSFDHKPNNQAELERIDRGGGFVIMNRVNGSLALSRALGDYQFKISKELADEDQVVTANPDVLMLPVTNKTEFMIIACDGIWDVMSNEEAVLFVRERIAKGDPLQEICNQMVDYCLSFLSATQMGAGMDNMTVVIVGFTLGGYKSLVSRCLRTYAQ